MAPRKHPGRCGCENSWTFSDAQENPSCCEHSQTAPCWYAMSFECRAYYASPYYSEEAGYVREPLLGDPLSIRPRGGCHFLAKNCITGCSWGDRWTTTAFGFETPYATITNCPTATVCDDVTTPPDSDGISADDNPFGPPSTSPCSITCPDGDGNCVPCSWADLCAGAVSLGTFDECVANVWGMKQKWEMLMISSTEATLTCTSNMGWTAQYYCGDFDPLNKSTFIRNEAAVHEKLIGLPVKICVIPISKPVANPCTTVADKCACNDPGFCSTSITVNVSGCGSFSGSTKVGLSRMYTVPGSLSGVTLPSPAPCGFFWGTLGSGSTSCSGYKDQLGIQIWCDGTTYDIEVYCLKVDNTWENVPGAAITNIIQTCFGPELYFTLPPVLPCCCGDAGPVDCSGCSTPATATLTIDVSLGTGCTDSTVVSLTRNGCDLEGTFTRHGLLRFVRVTWTGSTWRLQYWYDTTDPPVGAADYDQSSTSSPVCDPPYGTWSANDPNYCGIGLGISSVETLSA